MAVDRIQKKWAVIMYNNPKQLLCPKEKKEREDEMLKKYQALKNEIVKMSYRDLSGKWSPCVAPKLKMWLLQQQHRKKNKLMGKQWIFFFLTLSGIKLFYLHLG